MVDFNSRFPTPSYSANSASFSSTLLDAIYRSIDEGEDGVVVYRESMRKEKSYCSNFGVVNCDEEISDLRRARMIERWMEEKISEKVVVRRKSVPDFPSRKDPDDFCWSSSDSGGGGGGSGSGTGSGFVSSSEAESLHVQRPKPVRNGAPETVGEILEYHGRIRRGSRRGDDEEESEKKPKAKSRALKLYSELKKKQPISPGGKLAGLLNSLFAGGNSKKAKIVDADADAPSLKSSTCSSASSFSRSCLSKTPSSRGKSAKRSVRFSPVSVIVGGGDDYYPSKAQSTNFDDVHNNNLNEDLMIQIMEKTRRVDAIFRDLVQNYHRKNQGDHGYDFPIDHMRNSDVKNQDFNEDEDEDDDDGASYASSDLFELDNLSGIGMKELPVYETTHAGTNQAIADGVIS